MEPATATAVDKPDEEIHDSKKESLYSNQESNKNKEKPSSDGSNNLKQEDPIQPTEEIPAVAEDYGEQSNRNSNLEQEVDEQQEDLPDIMFTDGGMGTITHQQAMMFQPQIMMPSSQEPVAEMIDELQSEYIYTEIFRAFDLEHKG